jgi:hypothetical protein
MSSLLNDIPPVWRKRFYTAFAVAGLLVGGLAVAGVDVHTAPEVLTYLGVALGITAASNVSPDAPTADPAAPDAS